MRLVMVFFCAVLAALHKPCDTAAHEDDGLLHEPPGTGDPNIDIFHAAAAVRFFSSRIQLKPSSF